MVTCLPYCSFTSAAAFAPQSGEDLKAAIDECINVFSVPEPSLLNNDDEPSQLNDDDDYDDDDYDDDYTDGPNRSIELWEASSVIEYARPTLNHRACITDFSQSLETYCDSKHSRKLSYYNFCAACVFMNRRV